MLNSKFVETDFFSDPSKYLTIFSFEYQYESSCERGWKELEIFSLPEG